MTPKRVRRAQPPSRRRTTSQVRQKEMIARHFDRLAAAPDTGEKSAYTFVPGNLTELLLSFDLLPVLPEINSLQSAMRGKTAEYIALAEKLGHSEDVCTYVKSDIGMLKSGNIGPTGQRLPIAGPPAAVLHGLLHVHEVVRAAARGIPLPGRDAARAVPAGRPDHRVDARLRGEAAQGRGHPGARAGHRPRVRRGSAEGAPAAVGAGGGRPRVGAAVGEALARRRSTPTSAPSTTSARSSARSAAPRRPSSTTAQLRAEIEERMRARQGAGHAGWRHGAGALPRRRRGPAQLDELPAVLEDVRRRGRGRGGVHLHEGRRRVRPRLPPRSGSRRSRRSPTTASAATRTSACRRASTCWRSTSRSTRPTGSSSTPSRAAIRSAPASSTSCARWNAISGKPGGFIESDLVDPRYFSAANIKNRLESYFQMLEQKRLGGAA